VLPFVRPSASMGEEDRPIEQGRKTRGHRPIVAPLITRDPDGALCSGSDSKGPPKPGPETL
jgi:hypothetical protein